MIILFLFCALKGFTWTLNEQNLYQQRKFYELQMLLNLKQRHQEAQKIENLQNNLKGCKEIYQGSAQIESFMKCARFLNAEAVLKISKNKNKDIYDDMNLFCAQKSANKHFVDKIIKRNVFLSRSSWKECSSALWKQVYLTAYANFSATPVKTMAFVRSAEIHLGKNKFWKEKIVNLSRSP